MLYLFLATLCSATIALIFKYTENSNSNRYLITSANYFIAFAISLFIILYRKQLSGIVRTDSFFNEFKFLLYQDAYILSPYSSIVWGVIVGSVAGFFFFSSFIFYQKSVKENGVGISGTFAKLGILIPMIFSIIFWRELPSTLQWIGIVLSLVSIVMVNLSSESLERFDIRPTIILLFVLGGMAEFSNKIYQNYALNDYKAIFLFCTFFVAFSISILFTIRDRVKFNIKDILTGFAVGVPNLFSSYFLILSLDTVKTSVAYPVFSAGSILLINLGGFFIFKEKIVTKNKFAIALIVIALVFMNI